MHCFNHGRCTSVFRARLEDLLELEKERMLKIGVKKIGDGTLTLPTAAKIFHLSVSILQSLGWAWRWAEWWVENGDNWEPLLEEGQKEEDMTKEQLRIIDSTKESRCEDKANSNSVKKEAKVIHAQAKSISNSKKSSKRKRQSVDYSVGDLEAANVTPKKLSCSNIRKNSQRTLMTETFTRSL